MTQSTMDTSTLPKNGKSTPALLSSNSTLFWRVFVPVFTSVFLTGLSVAFWFADTEELYMPFSSVLWIRIALSVIWILWLWLMWRSLWKLKRIDGDDSHFYVSNYWVVAKYPWEAIENVVSEKKYGFKLTRFILKAPGKFGQTITFLPGKHFKEWMENRTAKMEEIKEQ